MNEVAIHELDERLQKQVYQAREALNKGGVDYVIQVCVELLKRFPAAFELRGLFWLHFVPDDPVTLLVFSGCGIDRVGCNFK